MASDRAQMRRWSWTHTPDGAWRLCLGILLFAVPMTTATAQFSDNSDTMTFIGVVNSIVAWIDNNQDATTPNGIADWDNSNLSSADTDSVAIFRLVTNTTVTLTATVQESLHQTIGADDAYLATYYRIDSDGDGTSSTGFLGSEAGGGVGGLFYVGGGSAAWESAESETAGIFLSPGKTITYVTQDGAALLTVTCRGQNGEDLGADSDTTEAPDTGLYTADLTLLATGI